MKAVMMTAVGGPEVLEVRKVPLPTIDRGNQLLVRLKAAGINPVDTKLRSRGTYYPDRLPTILGCDGAGVVEEVGPQVRRFRPGDEVFFCFGGIGNQPGTYAEYTVIEEDCVAQKPTHWSFVEAAAAPLVCITAWESLHDRGRIAPNSTVLIHAGAGGVGHVAIQLAVAAGARVATTVGNSEKVAFVQKLGAERPLLYREQDFVTETLAWTGGEGVDLAFDTVGGRTFAATFPAVRVYGDLVTILQPSAEVDWGVARSRNLRISLELMLTPMHLNLAAALRHQGKILEHCATLAQTNKLHIHVAETLPLAQAALAHQRIQLGSTSGKIVLMLESD
ncbi:NADPH:quinone reductase [Gammaproteobacteria bacterium]